jgi:hypothetical protein
MGARLPRGPREWSESLRNVPELTVTQIALGAGGLVVLAAYVTLIFVPAWTSYGRWWERACAGVMSLFILVTLVAVGAGIGAALVWTYDRWG